MPYSLVLLGVSDAINIIVVAGVDAMLAFEWVADGSEEPKCHRLLSDPLDTLDNLIVDDFSIDWTNKISFVVVGIERP